MAELRTYSADGAWLVLRSIRRFAYPLISSLTVVYPEGEAANFRRPPPRPMVRPRSTTDGAFAARANDEADRTSAKAWMPSGYAAQIYDKLASTHTCPPNRRRHLLRLRHRAPPPAPRVRRARPRDGAAAPPVPSVGVRGAHGGDGVA